MDTYYQKQRSIASLFTRFIIGFGAGFLGMITLGIIFFLSWQIIGDTFQSPNELTNAVGHTIGQIETHSLFLILIASAVFISTLITTLSYAFMSTLVEEHYTKKATTLTHVFYGNVVFFLFSLPLYVLMNRNFQTDGIVYVAILHAFLSCFFSIFVLQSLHQVKYVLVNLYGNLLGLILFLLLAVLSFGSFDQIVLVFLAYPFFMGVMAFSNRFLELFYAFLYTKTGLDMLNIDTTFGADYGVPVADKEFHEDDEFDKTFQL